MGRFYIFKSSLMLLSQQPAPVTAVDAETSITTATFEDAIIGPSFARPTREIPEEVLREAHLALQQIPANPPAAKRSLEAGRDGDEDKGRSCKECTFGTAKYVLEFVWKKVTEKCDKMQSDDDNSPDYKDVEKQECPKMKMWCAFVKAHPKMAQGFLIEKVRPLALGYMYCLGKSACKADTEPMEEIVNGAVIFGEEEDGKTSTTEMFYAGGEDLEVLGNVGQLVVATSGRWDMNEGDHHHDEDEEGFKKMFFGGSTTSGATAKWMWARADDEHEEGDENPLSRAMHFVKHVLGFEEPPLPPLPAQGDDLQDGVDVVPEDDADGKGKGKSHHGKGHKGKGKGDDDADGKGKGGKGKGKGKDKGKGEGKGKGKGDDNGKGKGKGDDFCPADSEQHKKEEASIAVPEIEGICKCCFRKLVRKVMAYAVKMTKKICAKDDNKPMVKAFCKWAAEHPEMAFGVLLAKVEPEKYALIPCMKKWGGHQRPGHHHRHGKHNLPFWGMERLPPPVMPLADSEDTVSSPAVVENVEVERPKKFKMFAKLNEHFRLPQQPEEVTQVAVVGEETDKPKAEFYV